MKPGTRWIAAIVGLLAVNVGAASILAIAANHGGSTVVPDYYRRAVRYDAALAQASRDRALGWTVAATITGGELVVQARDAAGAPIDDATVTVTGYHRAHPTVELHPALGHAGAGTYRGALATSRGIHDLTITIERGDARYRATVTTEAR